MLLDNFVFSGDREIQWCFAPRFAASPVLAAQSTINGNSTKKNNAHGSWLNQLLTRGLYSIVKLQSTGGFNCWRVLNIPRRTTIPTPIMLTTRVVYISRPLCLAPAAASHYNGRTGTPQISSGHSSAQLPIISWSSRLTIVCLTRSPITSQECAPSLWAKPSTYKQTPAHQL